MASALLNGSSDFLSVSSSPNLILGTGDFTVEAWVYLLDYSSANIIATKGDTAADSNGVGSWFFGTDITTGRMVFGTSSTQYLTTTGPIVPLNTWCHLAFTRVGTTWKTWLNGTAGATATVSYNLSGNGTFRIGRGRGTSANYFSGFVTDVRIVVGTAIYTSNFSVPSSRLTAITNTQFLFAPQDITSGFVDSSVNNYTITKNGIITNLGTIDPYSATFSVDNLSVSQNSSNNFIDFALVNANKTLFISTSDALIDKNVTSPEDAYSFS